jgi:hypothetical protein
MIKYIPFIIIVLISSISFSQSSCSKFYPFNEGATAEITFKNKRGRVASIATYTVKEVNTSGGVAVAVMNQVLKDDRGRELIENDYNITCEAGKVTIDFNSLYNAELMRGFEGMDVDVTGTNIDLPNDLSVGQTLPDGGIEVKVNMSGINMNMTTRILDRKVIGTETVTTPAGTFECYVLTSTTELEMAGTRSSTSKQWIAEGVGMVKVEDYNRSGRLTSSGLLTSFRE